MCRESTALQGQSLKEPKVLLRTSRSGQAVPLRSLELSRVAGAVAGQRPRWSLATGSSLGTSVFTMLELESHVTAALRRCLHHAFFLPGVLGDLGWHCSGNDRVLIFRAPPRDGHGHIAMVFRLPAIAFADRS